MAENDNTQGDLSLQDHGSVVLVQMNTDAGLTWVKENLETEGWQWLGVFVAIEPRAAEQIVQAAEAAGITVEGR